MSRSVNVGILGTGSIFRAYAAGIATLPELTVTRVADVDLDRARTAAAEFGIPAAGTTEELLADDDVEIVVNITPPTVHAPSTTPPCAPESTSTPRSRSPRPPNWRAPTW